MMTLVFTSEIMHNLMMDLLDLAQLEKNTFKLNKGFFSIFDVFDKAFAVVGHLAGKKNIELVKPELSPKFTIVFKKIYGDQNRFVQVLINFLSNSIKFSPRDSKILIHLQILAEHTTSYNNPLI